MFGVLTEMSAPGLATFTICRSTAAGSGVCSMHSEETTRSKRLKPK